MNIREKLSTLHRKQIISYDEGEKLGNITNVYFDRSTCSLHGVSMTPRFNMSDEIWFIPLNAVQKLGKHVVIVSGKNNLEKLPEDIQGNSLRDLKGIKIVTEEGKHLGELLDVNVFPKSGVISEILLYGPKKLKVDVKRDELSIGPDAIIVPGKYEKRIVNIDTATEGGFVIHTGKASLTVAESIKNAWAGMTAKMQLPEEAQSSSNTPDTQEEPKMDPQKANGRKLVASK